MHAIRIPFDYAAVLQQVDDVGEEDLIGLAEELRLDESRLQHIVKALRNKGLLRIRHTAHDTLVSLSSRGKRLLRQLWSTGEL